MQSLNALSVPHRTTKQALYIYCTRLFSTTVFQQWRFRDGRKAVRSSSRGSISDVVYLKRVSVEVSEAEGRTHLSPARTQSVFSLSVSPCVVRRGTNTSRLFASECRDGFLASRAERNSWCCTWAQGQTQRVVYSELVLSFFYIFFSRLSHWAESTGAVQSQ